MHSLGAGFGRLWASTAASNLADGVLLAGLPVLATTVSESPAEIAGVTVAVMLPMALSALPAGAAADRLDRRRVLVGGNAARAVGLAVIAGVVALLDVRLAAIYAAAALVGGSEVLVDTTAQTAVPLLVPRARLGAANARLGGTQVVLNDAIGAPLGSLLAAFGGVLFLASPALLYVGGAMLAGGLRIPATGGASGARDPASVREQIVEGARHLAGHRVLLRLAVVNGVANLGNMAFLAVFVVFVLGPLDLPESSYGVFLALVAVGGLVGSSVAELALRRLGQALILRVAGAVGLAVYVTVSVTDDPGVVGACALLLGVTSMIWNISTRVLRQALVPDRLLGRVTATMAAVALVATPVGAALGGLVAEVAGVRAAAWLAAASYLVVLLLLRPITPRAIAEADAAVDVQRTTAAQVARLDATSATTRSSHERERPEPNRDRDREG